MFLLNELQIKQEIVETEYGPKKQYTAELKISDGLTTRTFEGTSIISEHRAVFEAVRKGFNLQGWHGCHIGEFTIREIGVSFTEVTVISEHYVTPIFIGRSVGTDIDAFARATLEAAFQALMWFR